MKKIKTLFALLCILIFGTQTVKSQNIPKVIDGIEKSTFTVNGSPLEIYTLKTGKIKI